MEPLTSIPRTSLYDILGYAHAYPHGRLPSDLIKCIMLALAKVVASFHQVTGHGHGGMRICALLLLFVVGES